MNSYKQKCEVCGVECIGSNAYSEYTLLESNWRCPTGHYADDWAYGYGIRYFNLDGEELEIHDHYNDSEEETERNKEEIEKFIYEWYDRHNK